MKKSILAATLVGAVIGGGAARADTYVSAKELLVNNPAAASGVYNFDPDGVGGAAAFNTYADMTTMGGGWTLALQSIRNAQSPSTDIDANRGSYGAGNGFTVDVSPLAIDATAQIRHRILGSVGNVLFDGFYTGSYHDALPLAGSWTILTGSLAGIGLDYQLGMAWSTAANDVDNSSVNCAALHGQPWYYNDCFYVTPSSTYGSGGPYIQGSPLTGTYQIYVRETANYTVNSAVPEPASWALMIGGFGLAGAAMRRRAGLRLA